MEDQTVPGDPQYDPAEAGDSIPEVQDGGQLEAPSAEQSEAPPSDWESRFHSLEAKLGEQSEELATARDATDRNAGYEDWLLNDSDAYQKYDSYVNGGEPPAPESYVEEPAGDESGQSEIRTLAQSYTQDVLLDPDKAAADLPKLLQAVKEDTTQEILDQVMPHFEQQEQDSNRQVWDLKAEEMQEKLGVDIKSPDEARKLSQLNAEITSEMGAEGLTLPPDVLCAMLYGDSLISKGREIEQTEEARRRSSLQGAETAQPGTSPPTARQRSSFNEYWSDAENQVATQS